MSLIAKSTDSTKKKELWKVSVKIGKNSLLILSEVKERMKRKRRFHFWRMRIIAGKKTYT